MDPLGAPSQFVDVDTLLSWGDSYEDEVNTSDSTAEAFQEDTNRSPFLYNRDINGKVVLWKGDVALLNCTAIVNTSNESLTDKNPVSESIFMLAGPDLKEDLQKLKGCRTGEAKLTKGFNLAARFIIHTVGPKYKNRYRTAAESSLYSCYRNVLQLAKYGLFPHMLSEMKPHCGKQTLKGSDSISQSMRTVHVFCWLLCHQFCKARLSTRGCNAHRSS